MHLEDVYFVIIGEETHMNGLRAITPWATAFFNTQMVRYVGGTGVHGVLITHFVLNTH